MRVIEIAMEIAFPPEFLEKVRTRFGFRPVREVAMSTSVGGIGPLLRERLVAQGEQGIEAIGVTLLYETTWIQSWFDWGQLHLEKREVAPYLRELLKECPFTLSVPMYDGSVVKSRVWELAYGKSKVFFLDCPPITHVVYPSEEDAPPKEKAPIPWGEELRFKQSWLIGRASLALVKTLQFSPDLIVLSETPTLFGHHRLGLDDFHNDSYFDHTRYIFNDHTPLEYAHPVWSRATAARLKLDVSTYAAPAGVDGKNGDVDITRLLIGLVEGVYGVSAKHARVMKAMPSLKDYADKIEAITNGVHIPYWQDPEFKNAAQKSDEDLLALRQKKKTELLDWIWRHYGLWHTWKEQVQGKIVVCWTRRITGYKRMDLLNVMFKDAAMKKQFLDINIVLLVGGRIHQHDDQAQAMVYNLLDLIATDKALQERVILLDNFNVWMAPRIFQGADAAIMLADDGREASATGFMKAQVNGDIILATDDGAIPESVVFAGKDKSDELTNGFEVPYVHGHPTPEGLLKALKNLAQTVKTPARHAAMMRAALRAEAQVDVNRTANEMRSFYDRILAKPLTAFPSHQKA